MWVMTWCSCVGRWYVC